MSSQRGDAEHLLDRIFLEALFLQADSGKRLHHILSTGAGYHPFDLNTDHPSAALFRGNSMGGKSVYLLGTATGDGSPLLHGIDGTDRYFRTRDLLSLDNGLCYCLGEH